MTKFFSKTKKYKLIKDGKSLPQKTENPILQFARIYPNLWLLYCAGWSMGYTVNGMRPPI